MLRGKTRWWSSSKNRVRRATPLTPLHGRGKRDQRRPLASPRARTAKRRVPTRERRRVGGRAGCLFTRPCVVVSRTRSLNPGNTVLNFTPVSYCTGHSRRRAALCANRSFQIRFHTLATTKTQRYSPLHAQPFCNAQKNVRKIKTRATGGRRR